MRLIDSSRIPLQSISSYERMQYQWVFDASRFFKILLSLFHWPLENEIETFVNEKGRRKPHYHHTYILTIYFSFIISLLLFWFLLNKNKQVQANINNIHLSNGLSWILLQYELICTQQKLTWSSVEQSNIHYVGWLCVCLDRLQQRFAFRAFQHTCSISCAISMSTSICFEIEFN